MDTLRSLADPKHVARFQRFCGVELVKPGTCDQQTQTKRQSSFDDVEMTNGSTAQHIASGLTKNNARILNECNNNLDKKNCQTEEENSCNGSAFSPDGHSCTNAESDNCKTYSNKNGVTSPSEDATTKGSSKVPRAYKVKHKALLYLAYFGAFLGNEECYLTFFPFCVWNLDSLIVRQVSLLWGLVMYLGQALKDYLRWPRPACPPVARLEFSYLQEFSMPSTHAMAGTAIPMLMARLVMDRYQVPVPVVVVVAIFWFTTTCYSRLFLGVHTILDLLAGIVFSVSLYVTFITYIEDYDLYQQTHRFAPVMVVLTALMLCTVCYPSQHKISSKGDAVQIVAAVAGFSVGFWLNYQLGYSHAPNEVKLYDIPFPTLYWVFLCVARFLSGSAVLAACYLVLKPSTIRFFSYLYGLEVVDKTNTNVVTGYKFTTYFTLGIIISFFIPLMHVRLGIPRPAFFEEVL